MSVLWAFFLGLTLGALIVVTADCVRLVAADFRLRRVRRRAAAAVERMVVEQDARAADARCQCVTAQILREVGK